MQYSPFGNQNEIYDKGKNMGKLMDDPTLVEIGKKYNKTGAQVALAWGIAHGYDLLKISLCQANRVILDAASYRSRRLRAGSSRIWKEISSSNLKMLRRLTRWIKRCDSTILVRRSIGISMPTSMARRTSHESDRWVWRMM